jgi:TATA-box binding protein (TBP) (component of TFIID and TFIIIB)
MTNKNTFNIYNSNTLNSNQLDNNLQDNINKNNIKLNSDEPKDEHMVSDTICKIRNDLQLFDMPDDVTISTMTLVCHINAIFNVANIGNYLKLNLNKIISVKYGKTDVTNRTLIHKKQRKATKPKNKSIKNFFNQVSIETKSQKGKKINIKLFSNGAIQMTGCKDLKYSLEALNILFTELKQIKAVYDENEKKIVEKPFVTDITELNLEKLQKIKVAMINSNFNIGFKIDRDKLFQLLHSTGYENSTYDPNIHACVNVKYESGNKTVSIFVFESGAIIITGANNSKQIFEAYNFINKLLCENYKQLVKHDILSNSAILMHLA